MVLAILLTVKTNHSAGEEVIKMPRGDGSGPMGSGPQTGKGAGFCIENPGPDYVNQMPGRGLGRGFGRGRGFGGGMGRGRRFGGGGLDVEQSPQDERLILQKNVETLESQLNVINKRLKELAAQDKPES